MSIIIIRTKTGTCHTKFTATSNQVSQVTMTKTLQLPVQVSTTKAQPKPTFKPKVKLNLTSLTRVIRVDVALLTKKSLHYLPKSPLLKSRRDEVRLDTILDEEEAKFNQGNLNHEIFSTDKQYFEEIAEEDGNSSRDSIFGTDASTDVCSSYGDSDCIESWNIESVPLRKRMQRESVTYFRPARG